MSNRRINMYSGTVVNVTKLSETDNIHELKVHPKDSSAIIEAEVRHYHDFYRSLATLY